MPSLTWCLLSESLSSAAVTEEEASGGDVGGMYLQAESSVMVPVVIMQMAKVAKGPGREGEEPHLGLDGAETPRRVDVAGCCRGVCDGV